VTILDRVDSVFYDCLGCLCPAPFPTAELVEQKIDEAIIKAKVLAERLYKMTFKEQLANDLENIMNADEVSEEVTYSPRNGSESSTIKAIFNDRAESNLAFTDGEAVTPTAVILKSSLAAAPKHNDSITDSDNRVWIVKGIAGESFSSWTLSLIGDVRIK
jgi:hypothetical protein